MNPRIQELANQAQQYAECTTPQGLEWFKTFQERFAELIVKECTDFLKDKLDDHFAAEQLEEHFYEEPKYED
jgi:hypothetical protein